MSAAHTAGPWTWYGSELLSPTEFVMDASMGSWPKGADRSLIATAPDLLALAVQYRDDLQRPPAPDSVERRLERTNAVIAKALGRTPNEIGEEG